MTRWKHQIKGINVFIKQANEGQISTDYAMSKIAELIRKCSLYKQAEIAEAEMTQTIEQEDLLGLVEEMEYAVIEADDGLDRDYFETLLECMYDWADGELVWIEPVAAL